jgi:hypothetical protein
MLVPKTAVDKNGLATANECQVGPSRKVFAVKAISVPEFVH